MSTITMDLVAETKTSTDDILREMMGLEGKFDRVESKLDYFLHAYRCIAEKEKGKGKEKRR